MGILWGQIEWVCDFCRQGKARVTRTPEQREVQRAATAARFALARQSPFRHGLHFPELLLAQ
jgi:hypothetical protein